MNRSDIVRAAYQRFNEGDFDGALDLCDPDIEFRDVIGHDGTVSGREAVRRRWAERFSHAHITVTVGEVSEMGDAVVAAVCCQVYGPTGEPVGPPVLVTDHFSFRDDRILRVESTVFDGVPEEVKDFLLHVTP
ncbi:MAG TPA: nuclear transport factor 2 family protein [Acidimicrobiales bacterium]|nr:nuclear transport factor 2 family protein [Acidimicrobiales bacterium]